MKITIIMIFVLMVYSSSRGTDKWWPDKCNTFDTLQTNTGKKIFRYKCTKTRHTRAEVKDGSYNGIYQSWDNEGNLRAEKEYCMDDLCGKESVYDSLGNILKEGNFSKEGKPVGIHRIFYSADHPEKFISYNNSGERHGWEVNWYENGNVKDSIRYENGDMVYYWAGYKNGKVRYRVSEFYVERMKRKNAVFYTKKGKTCGKIVNGNGTYILNSDDAKNRWLETYKDGEEIASRKLQSGENPVLSK